MIFDIERAENIKMNINTKKIINFLTNHNKKT